jgi:uncharacterized protein (TIGR03083 family)
LDRSDLPEGDAPVSMGFGEHLLALGREGDAFVSLLPRASLDEPVVACPGWTVREVARHTGGVHRKFATVIRERRLAPMEGALESIAGGWPSDARLVEWFAEGHASLLDALAGAPADLQCYTPWPTTSPRDMWVRRQAHETAIHRADVLAPSGQVPEYPAVFAADGIDEVVRYYRARPKNRPRPPRTVVLCVRPDDVDAVWSIRMGPDVYEVGERAESSDVTMTGTASDLYLRLWNRQGLGSSAVSGDDAMLRYW